MNLIRLLKPEAPVQANTLEEILGDIERYGEPRLGKYHNKWNCNVELNVVAVGATFKVSSEYNSHATPIAAAIECQQRVRDALDKLGKGMK